MLAPPSTTKVWPFMPAAADEHKNCTAKATSSGVTNRRIGDRLAASASLAAPCGIAFQASVATAPGAITLTRIPCGASSAAKWRASDSSAPFEAPTTA